MTSDSLQPASPPATPAAGATTAAPAEEKVAWWNRPITVGGKKGTDGPPPTRQPKAPAVQGPQHGQPAHQSAPGGSGEEGTPEAALAWLLAQGKLNQAKLHEARLQLPQSGRTLGALLVELGALDERDLAQALAHASGFPYTDLRGREPSAAALQAVPQALAQQMGLVPLRILDDGRLEIAAADPANIRGLTNVARIAQRELAVLVAPASSISRIAGTAYRGLLDVGGLVQKFEAGDSARRAARAVIEARPDDDAPVVQLVTELLTRALRERASDIHVEPQGDRVRIRFRIDGALHDVLALPAAIGPAVVSRMKIMASLNIADRRRPQDGQMALTIDERKIDVRINTCPTVWGEKATLRLLDRTRVIYRLDELGMREDTYKHFGILTRSPVGMVVCAGPTGSGKTTTLYATLAEVNQTERNVTTIEDPVEYVFPSLTQIQVNEQSGLTFANGLRSILRQDPDVILIGEIRDAESSRIAIESALTGHLVLTSLHAIDACSALQRLVDMGIEAFLVASTVTGLVSQRLFRRLCERCRIPEAPRPDEAAFYALNKHPDSPALAQVWRASGCENCTGTGYRDRIGVFELVRMTDPLRAATIAGASVDELRRIAEADGTRSLAQEALHLVGQGITSIEEIARSLFGGASS
ncbi:MAG: GspE/PulE family protein [Sporichthyaceae bacterium]